MYRPNLLFPGNVKKYTGTIRSKAIGYQICVKNKYYGNFSTYNEALQGLIDKNMEEGLNIKNLVYEFPNHLEVALTRGFFMKISKEDLPLAENMYGTVALKRLLR